MSPRTPFLSRLIGLYAILVALSMFSRGQATVETVAALLQNPSMVFVLGVVKLAAGLAMVLAHNIWSGGALVVVVTLVGWMTLIVERLHYQQLFYFYWALPLVLGLYLTYGGFRSPPQ
jgi:putative exporter of polyketide antibiotics